MNQSTKWKEILDQKVKVIHNQIASLKIYVENHNGDDALFNSMVEPYYKLLDNIFQEEYPFSNAIDNSDLVLKLEGVHLNIANPKLSLISSVFNNVRKQVTNVTKAVADIIDINKSLPKELDLGLSAIAKGSVILGFTVPFEELTDRNHQINLLGKEDPLFKATKEAIKTIGLISRNVSEEIDFDSFDKEVSDPKVRDTALVAIKSISPSGRTDIERVGIIGKSFPSDKINYLTSDTRKNLQQIIKQPVRSKEVQHFEGIVREIDLDIRRFELRRIVEAEIQDIRCTYSIEFDKIAQNFLNKKLRVKGKVDRAISGKPRLLQIDDIKII